MFNFVSVLQEPAENIVKLRTTPPLFQAYEYAYSLLENSLCPLFHESDDVSNLMQKHYRIFINLCNFHFGPIDVESWEWYQLSWFLVTFLNHPRWKLGRGIAVGYSCFIFQFLDIIIVLPNVLHNFCTASLNLCLINWVKSETCLKNYLLFVSFQLWLMSTNFVWNIFFLYVNKSRHRDGEKLWNDIWQI